MLGEVLGLLLHCGDSLDCDSDTGTDNVRPLCGAFLPLFGGVQERMLHERYQAIGGHEEASGRSYEPSVIDYLL